ncbi:MAG TPA: prolyl oligopeptidase family serine peptidase [Limnochordales bacterium]
MAVRPYGMWPSPLTPARVAAAVRLTDVAWEPSGRSLVWHEERSGQGVVVAVEPDEPASAMRDVTAGQSVRARVGYGGGDFAVGPGVVYFVGDGGRIYRQPLSRGTARPITPGFGAAASPAPSPDGRWVVYVHSYERRDVLAVADAEGRGWPQVLVEGDDFYMQPAWHPSGRLLAFVSWRHPHMPWDSSVLWLAHLELPEPGRGGLPRVVRLEAVAGGDGVSVFQPAFSPDGRWLAYVSDEGGWGNVHLYDLAERRGAPLLAEPAEHGRPAWRQGMRTLAWSPDGRRLFYLRSREGFTQLWACDVESRQAGRVGGPEGGPLAPYTALEQIAVSPADGRVALLASSPSLPWRVLTLEPGAGAGALKAAVWRRSEPEELPESFFSRPEPRRWPTSGGAEAFGLYYPPSHPDFQGSGPPPLIVRVHGGPTSQAEAEWSPGVAFFTSRGYAVLEVNYRGSTGYGRAYRDALKGQWGVYDVEDAVSGARAMVEAGLADPQRLVIMGGSAGGYTVLRALVTHPGFFKAAVCLYGVSNLFTLAAETHKFEERYLDSLVGPLPEAAARYRERSPALFAERIQDPIAIFQGEEDQVVPKNQSDAVVEVLRRRGVPHEYHVYPGEGHGWRRRETVEAFYRAVESFLLRHVVFA